MSSIYSWSTTASDNGNSDSGINFTENQAPSTVNNSARQVMGRLAEWLGDIGGSLSAGGTANALTLTANSAFTAYADGIVLTFKATANNTGATTLSANTLGAKSIRRIEEDGSDVALEGGEIRTGGIYTVRYSTDANSGAGGWLLDWQPRIKSINYVPVGSVTDFAGTTAPSGWLLCFGQAISRTTYDDLFTAIGTTYGTGDGSTTFNLPDLRGRVTAGQDDMGGTSANRLTNQLGGLNGDTLGAAGGAETHTLATNQIPSHSHGVGSLATQSDGNHDHNIPFGTGAGTTVAGAGGGTADTLRTGFAGTHTHTITGSTASTGSGNAHNNVQPTFILNKIIFTGVE